MDPSDFGIPNLSAAIAPPPTPGGLPPVLTNPLGTPPPGTFPTLPQAQQPQVNPPTALDKDQAKLQGLKDSGSGVDHFEGRHPVIGGIMKGLDIAGTILAPRVAAAIPGSTLNHQQQLGQAQAAVGQDLGNEQQQAQTANLSLQPELKQQKLDQQQQQFDDKQSATATSKTQQDERDLRNHGYKRDEAGAIVPLAYGEMSPNDQAIHDLKASQQEEQDASAALKNSQNDPHSAAYRIAQGRLQVARQNAQTAAGRLGLSGLVYQMHAHGTDGQGNALPGAALMDDGTPVGSVFQRNVTPTGTERNKGDMAQSAHEQLGTLKDIVANRPDIFGPANGRKTDFTVWVGSQDPDAQRFRAARTIAGDHLAGTFGGRSEAALTALDNAIGNFKDNPKAVAAGLDQLDKANNVFKTRGTPRVSDGKGGVQGSVGSNQGAEETRSYQGHTYVKGPQGWHLQQ